MKRIEHLKPDHTHPVELRQIDGVDYWVCKACGATDVNPSIQIICRGAAPALEIIDDPDSDLIAIQWSFPEGGIKSSTFPQPLITIDHALDGRPIQIVFAGKRARELRKALRDNGD